MYKYPDKTPTKGYVRIEERNLSVYYYNIHSGFDCVTMATIRGCFSDLMSFTTYSCILFIRILSH